MSGLEAMLESAVVPPAPRDGTVRDLGLKAATDRQRW
jgi:hypothetical protein